MIKTSFGIKKRVKNNEAISNKTNIANKLLPAGFCDLIFDEAEKNHHNINLILELFLKQKFRLIKTPLVEFEDSILGNENNFKTVDVVSNKTLIFRNDITLQIARLLQSKLQNQKLPLKLCYVGDVLCAKNNGFNNDRQQTQIGIEIIGCDQEKSDLEIIETTLKALKKVISKNILIEVSLPDFLDIFLAKLSLEATKKAELANAILGKNISKIREILPKKYLALEKSIMKNSDLAEISKNLLRDFPSTELANELKKAENINKSLKKNKNTQICFDLFGDQKSLYHNSIAFDIFIENLPTPIAKGGRYKINNLDAIGSTIYMNNLQSLIK